jgi:hypothetical protein
MICKVLKLSTGETIIASIEVEATSFIDIRRPVKVILVPQNENTFTAMMMKWDSSMNFDLPVRIFKSSIVSVAEPTESFKDSYIEIYSEFETYLNGIDDSEDQRDVRDVSDDDLSSDLEKIMKLMKSSANTTIH